MRQTYTVQVEGVGRARGVGRGGEGDLDGLVDRECVDASGGQEVLGSLRAAQNLKEDGDSGRRERRVVDEEVGAVKVESHVDSHIDTALSSDARLQGRWYEYQTASYASRQTWPVPFSS